MNCQTLLDTLAAGTWDERISQLYCCGEAALPAHRARIAKAVAGYREFSAAGPEVTVFSAPGRTELGGNHTDHQHGCVLAASVNLDLLAVAAPNGSDSIRILSEGYPLLSVKLDALTPQAEEEGTSAALVRGVAALMTAEGHAIGGFDAYVCSGVPAGSGLSSSAAYEVLIGVMVNHFFCGGGFDPVRIAQIGQAAENRFFGKPCGLMDQMASAVGGIVAIDFADPACPLVRRVDFDFPAAGHALCIIDSGADHADLTDEYAAIPREMCAVAAALGKGVLREVDEAELERAIPALRETVGDRAVLRALHFFGENRRAQCESTALEQGDFQEFLRLVRASGRSSALYLQNASVAATPRRQAIPVALAVAEEILGDRGAVRVHGGGFAGTIQAFVPVGVLPQFVSRMEALLGRGSCHVLSIRPQGGCVLFG
ncbi:MAG: galactokinase family protein [Oscillibacter sp.]